MSEIEKMFENAGIYDFRYDCDVSFTDGQFGRITNCSKGEVKDYCTDKKYFKSAKVINYKRLYPPFTAEKQLELIKWLASFDLRIEYANTKYFIETHFHGYSVYIECFEQALAGFINNLWQDLTESEKEEIRGILNG